MGLVLRRVGHDDAAGRAPITRRSRRSRRRGAVPDFQFHHQPFNYYAAFDPVTHADARAAKLKD